MVDALEANGWLADTAAMHHRLSAEPCARRRGALRGGTRTPRQSGALYLCDPVFGDEPEGLYLSDATAPPSAMSCCRSPAWRPPTGSSCRGSPACRWVMPARRARPPGHSGCRPCSPPRSRHPTTASPTCSSRGSESIACCVSRRPSAPHGTGDLLAALYLGHSTQRRGRRPQPSPLPRRPSRPASPPADGRDELPLAAAGALWANAPALADGACVTRETRGQVTNGQQDAERGARQRRQSLLRARGGRRHRAACRRGSRPHPAELGRQRALRLAARNACDRRPRARSPSTSRCCTGSTTA